MSFDGFKAENTACYLRERTITLLRQIDFHRQVLSGVEDFGDLFGRIDAALCLYFNEITASVCCCLLARPVAY